LEHSLGLRLLERGSRSLRLTEEGAALHARTEGLLREIVEAAETISVGLGRLRVNALVVFAHVALGRIAAEFISATAGTVGALSGLPDGRAMDGGATTSISSCRKQRPIRRSSGAGLMRMTTS
jgi:hypothetical protein